MKYRCQSALKLVELDAKFNIFRDSQCNTALDLAAAPGGFAQVALERMNACGRADPPPKVIGVDLRAIEPLAGLETVRCNILNHREVLKQVGNVLRRDHSDSRSLRVVLHDGVSVVPGQRALSVTYSQNQMTLSALQLACAAFRDFGGDDKHSIDVPSFFVTKVMQSKHLARVKRAAETRFRSVILHRPAACKEHSPETYMVMRGLRPANAMGGIGNPAFSLPPLPEDAAAMKAGSVVWFCLGCGQNRMGCRPCPACARR